MREHTEGDGITAGEKREWRSRDEKYTWQRHVMRETCSPAEVCCVRTRGEINELLSRP